MGVGPQSGEGERGVRLAGTWPPGKREEGDAGGRGTARPAEDLSL